MSARRWVVGKHAGAPETLRVVLEAMGDREAFAEGRAFVGKARPAAADVALAPGTLIEVWAPRASRGEEAFEILAWDGELLVANKPAELSTVPDHRGTCSLVTHVAKWLASRQIEGDPHPVSRLDVGVSGCVLFAVTHRARKRVEEAARAGGFEKRYAGIARSKLVGEGELEGAVGKSTGRGRHGPRLDVDGRAARSRFRVVADAGGASLLELEPLTGRTHQLRLHLESAGAPLYGDRLHGGLSRITSSSGKVVELRRVMLHALRVEVRAPGRAPFVAEASVPRALREAWTLLDGDDAAWNALDPMVANPCD